MGNTHRIGIVGVGAIAGLHGRAIRDIEGAELVASCGGSQPKAEAFQAEYGGQWFESIEQLLDADLCDVVTICTPSGAHMAPTVEALKRGVHVLCEKPLEVDLQRAGEMITVAKGSEARLGGIFPQRFNPVVQAAHGAALVVLAEAEDENPPHPFLARWRLYVRGRWPVGVAGATYNIL